MTDEMHPQVAAVLAQAQRLQSLMDDQLAKMKTQEFTAADETGTVEVTLNGHSWLTNVYLEDGVLRSGAQVVEGRVNEALQKAMAEAGTSIEADREYIDSVVAEITGDADRDERWT